MKNFKKLPKNEMQSVKGGRLVIKIDRDGDGKWDEKHVWTNGGKYIKKER